MPLKTYTGLTGKDVNFSGIGLLTCGCCGKPLLGRRVGRGLGTLEMGGLGFPNHTYSAVVGSKAALAVKSTGSPSLTSRAGQ